ncbi:uncharacterized protein [Elaeis guineensis]|uniref:Uncharacterized protein LOC105054085 n=1 Tax=Elaeis guineensis var. tenera TaxID=51953 RepID=A0A6I9RWX8_ELAGV|nr:uncharacterized protein LOC105054085 [Elaeis guineensis]
MGEETSVPLDSNLTSSSSARFFGLLNQPDSDPYPNLEFDESDVVWSSSFSSASELSSGSSSPSAAGLPSYSPSESYRHRRSETRSFVPERSGLSAALAEDSLPLVRQRRRAAAAARGSVSVPVPAGRAGAEEAGGGMGMGMGKGFHQSAPVNVPAWPSWRRGRRVEAEDGEEERGEEEEEEEEMVPPHVIVARSHVMTFSVFEGVGRTLKGRDLRRVRNAVLQKTGFL